MTLCQNPRCRGDDEPRETHGLATVCSVCVGRLRARVAQLPALVRWLQAHVEPGRRGETDRVTGSAEPPVPIRTDVISAVGPASLHGTSDPDRDQVTVPNIPMELFTWCRVVAEERELYGPARVDPEACATWLLAHLDWIAQQQWCVELLDEVNRMHASAHTLAPWSPERHHLPAPCPSCDAKALIRYSGDDYVKCESRAGGCNREWTEAEYERLVHVLADEWAHSA